MARIVIGFLAAALWLPALGHVLDEQMGPFWAIMFGPYTAPLTLLIAVPSLYFMRRKITLLRCVVTGAGIRLVGALTFIINPLAFRVCRQERTHTQCSQDPLKRLAL
jgi:hypothetical protein